jgi:hypothetical protein
LKDISGEQAGRNYQEGQGKDSGKKKRLSAGYADKGQNIRNKPQEEKEKT